MKKKIKYENVKLREDLCCIYLLVLIFGFCVVFYRESANHAIGKALWKANRMKKIVVKTRWFYECFVQHNVSCAL